MSTKKLVSEEERKEMLAKARKICNRSGHMVRCCGTTSDGKRCQLTAVKYTPWYMPGKGVVYAEKVAWEWKCWRHWGR